MKACSGSQGDASEGAKEAMGHFRAVRVVPVNGARRAMGNFRAFRVVPVKGQETKERVKERRKILGGILLLEAEKAREQLSLMSVGCSKQIWRWLLINNCPG